jgi:tetratricopeptide (TPR) repeat protein
MYVLLPYSSYAMNKFLYIFLFAGIFLFACNGQEQKKKSPEKTAQVQKANSLEELNRKIEEEPGNAGLYMQRAAIYQQQIKTNDAIVDVQRAIALDTLNTAYYLVLADYYMQAGQLKNTIGVLKKVLSIEPENTAALNKMAEINLLIRKYKDVFTYTTKALEADPYNAKSFFIRGYTYKEMGDTGRAIENFMQTVKYEPDNYRALTELGLIYSARKNPMAVDYFNNAIAADSSEALAWYYLAMYYQNNDMLNEALDIYRDLMKHHPEFQYAYYNTGYIYLELLKVPDEAIPYFNQALQVNPNYYEAYFNRGLCYEILGDVTRAEEDYNAALRIRPNYQKAIDGLNRVHEIMRR